MGSTPDDIASLLRRNPKANGIILQDEIPKHRVFLEAFYIDKYEMTNAHFQQVARAQAIDFCCQPLYPRSQLRFLWMPSPRREGVRKG